jgi:colanic acid biosynthesis glycosyl transferase WcaI
MVQRLLSYLSFNALATLVGLVQRQRPDVILCTNGSFFTGFTALVGWGWKRVPFVYNVQDLYPETPVAAGQLRGKRAIAALERLERAMYRAAAQIAVITPSFRENIVGKGVDPAKISVVPNFVDTDFIRPLPKVNELSTRLGLADRFVVTHAGNLGYVYDLDTLLDAAALLRNEPDIVFLIVGDGVARPALERKAAELQLENVRFLPFQPHADLPFLRATSDVQVSLYRPGAGRYSMPSKVYEIMASGRRLLASADAESDVWKLVAEAGCGVCVPPLEPRRLAEAVLALRDDAEGRQEMGRRGRELACQHYSVAAVVEQYAGLLQRAAEHHGRRNGAG